MSKERIFFFDIFFSIEQGPSNVGKLNWDLLGFFSFIFSLAQCDMIYGYRKGHLWKACFEARDNLCHKIREWKDFPIIFEAGE